MEERLQKIIAARTGISRRAAERYIEAGYVTVNGAVAKLGDRADPDADEICLRGELLAATAGKKYYIALNKPVGYVTTMSDEKGRHTVAELVSDVPERVYPVGRLDINSEGLLIMTNDGDFANRVMHPSFEKDKVYRVWVSGDAQSGAKRLAQPMELDGVRLRPARVRLVRTIERVSIIDITIHEGRNRQVRRMCDIAGLKVLRLVRIAVGEVRLGTLPKGHWRELTPAEVAGLGGDACRN